MKIALEKLKHELNQEPIIRDERGLSTVEYVILLVLIAASSISLWVSFGDELRGKIVDSTEELDDVVITTD